MNRAERRKFLKKNPALRHTIKSSAQTAVKDLEKMLEKKWKNDKNEERNPQNSIKIDFRGR